MKYTVNYFINKFSSIPREDWVVGYASDLNSPNCALGHCGGYSNKSLESLSLCNIMRKYFELRNIPRFSSGLDFFVWSINDDVNNIFTVGNNAKSRILYALNYIKNSRVKNIKTKKYKTRYKTVLVNKIQNLKTQLV